MVEYLLRAEPLLTIQGSSSHMLADTVISAESNGTGLGSDGQDGHLCWMGVVSALEGEKNLTTNA